MDYRQDTQPKGFVQDKTQGTDDEAVREVQTHQNGENENHGQSQTGLYSVFQLQPPYTEQNNATENQQNSQDLRGQRHKTRSRTNYLPANDYNMQPQQKQPNYNQGLENKNQSHQSQEILSPANQLNQPLQHQENAQQMRVENTEEQSIFSGSGQQYFQDTYVNHGESSGAQLQPNQATGIISGQYMPEQYTQQNQGAFGQDRQHIFEQGYNDVNNQIQSTQEYNADGSPVKCSQLLQPQAAQGNRNESMSNLIDNETDGMIKKDKRNSSTNQEQIGLTNTYAGNSFQTPTKENNNHFNSYANTQTKNHHNLNPLSNDDNIVLNQQLHGPLLFQKNAQTDQLNPGHRKMSENLQQNAPNSAYLDEGSGKMLREMGGESEKCISDMLKQIDAECDQLDKDSKHSHYDGHGSVDDDHTSGNISAFQSNTQSNQMNHPSSFENPNRGILLNADPQQMKNRSVERQQRHPSSEDNFNGQNKVQLERGFNLSQNNNTNYQQQNQKLNYYDPYTPQVQFRNQQPVHQQNIQNNFSPQQAPMYPKMDEAQVQNNYQYNYQQQQNMQQQYHHQQYMDNQNNQQSYGLPIDTSQQNEINQIQKNQQFLQNKMQMDRDIFSHQQMPNYQPGQQASNQFNRMTNPLNSMSFQNQQNQGSYMNENQGLQDQHYQGQVVNNDGYYGRMGAGLSQKDQFDMMMHKQIMQQQNVAVADYQARINRDNIKQVHYPNQQDMMYNQVNNQYEQQQNYQQYPMMNQGQLTGQNQQQMMSYGSQSQSDLNLMNQLNKLDLNQQQVQDSYYQQQNNYINPLQNNMNQYGNQNYHRQNYQGQQSMLQRGNKKNNSQQNLDTQSLEPGFSQIDNEDFHPEIQLGINYDNYNKTSSQRKQDSSFSSRRGNKKMKNTGRGRGSGSQKANYLQNVLEVDISEMECNSQGQNKNQSHHSGQIGSMKQNSHPTYSGQKGTDTRTNTTEGFSNRADKQGYLPNSEQRDNEDRDPMIRRVSEQGSASGVFYGNQNEEAFSTSAKIGGISGKYTNKARSTGGNTKSMKSGQGSGGGTYGNNNSHDANTSNKSYDERIAQIQHDIKLAKKDPEKEFQVLDGKIIDLATKKVGSKFLQDHLSVAKQSLINKIIDQIDGHLPDLMTDNYGNYFCSELINYLQGHQRIHFLEQIKGQKFIEISCNSRGTWALQNIIYAATQDREFEIIQQTLCENDNICKLSQDKEGHHMIEKIIMTFGEEKRYYIFQEICNNFDKLAKDKQGLCVMKKLIEKTKNVDSQKLIVQKIISNGLEYVQNAYGNFVVSEVLTQFDYDICGEIFKQIKTHFVQLSQFKFSSKFIEVCIDMAPSNIQDEIITEFCESSYLNKVVQSGFGNFVLQNSIESYCKAEKQRVVLIDRIIGCLHEVNDYKLQSRWGREILNRMIQNPKLISNTQERDRLNKFLQDKVQEIDQKQKMYKQQQTLIQRGIDSGNNQQRGIPSANHRGNQSNQFRYQTNQINFHQGQDSQYHQNPHQSNRQYINNPQMGQMQREVNNSDGKSNGGSNHFKAKNKETSNQYKQKQNYQKLDEDLTSPHSQHQNNKSGNISKRGGRQNQKRGPQGSRPSNQHQSYQYNQNQEPIIMKQESITFANKQEQSQQQRDSTTSQQQLTTNNTRQVIQAQQEDKNHAEQVLPRNRSNSRNEVKSSSGGTDDKEPKDDNNN